MVAKGRTYSRALFLTSIFSLASCAHETKLTPPSASSPLGQSPSTPVQTSPQGAQADLQALRAAVDRNPALADLVTEIDALLQASIQQSAGDDEEALASWWKALTHAQGALAAKAWQGWVEAFAHQKYPQAGASELADGILEATQHGSLVPYMKQQGLNRRQVLLAYLSKQEKIKLPLSPAEGSQDPLSLPALGSLPANDPLLLGSAQRACKAPAEQVKAWVAWAQSLSAPLLAYFDGLTARCRQEPELAIAQLKLAAPQLVSDERTRAQGITAYRALVKLQRHNDSRIAAADSYLALMKAWEVSSVKAEQFGWSAGKLIETRIADTLWASRYRAFAGDYSSAKELGMQAMALIKAAYSGPTKLTSKLTDSLAESHAEAYHTLAFRVAIEEGAYPEALRLADEGLSLPHLSRHWRNELLWYKGFYAYLAGQLPEATAAWQKLLQSSLDQNRRSKVLFWIARAHGQMGQQQKQARALKELAEQAPLSFYNIVAPSINNTPAGKPWQSLFANPAALAQALTDARSFDLARVRSKPKVGRLLSQTEVLLAANLPHWAAITSAELYYALRQHFTPRAEADAYLYVSRLLHGAGEHAKSGQLTADLAATQANFWQKRPEQILVLFPQPFAETYRRLAAINEVDAAYLFAVSRQESSFDPQVVSHANAIGLMQVIPPTARRMAPQLGLAWDDIKHLLNTPEVNIALGSHYIHLLKNQYGANPAATFAAYNAGGQAVDTWLTRRAHPDPLVWIELIPFGETRHYVQVVWRNLMVYQHLGSKGLAAQIVPQVPVKRHAAIRPRTGSPR